MLTCSSAGKTDSTTPQPQITAGLLLSAGRPLVGCLLLGLLVNSAAAQPTAEAATLAEPKQASQPKIVLASGSTADKSAVLPQALLQAATRDFASLLAELAAALAPNPHTAVFSKTNKQVALSNEAAPLDDTALSQALHQLRLWSYSHPLPAATTKATSQNNQHLTTLTQTTTTNQQDGKTKHKLERDAVTPEQLQQLHQLLQQLSRSTVFRRHDETALRLQEQFAVLLYRYYPRSGLQHELASMLPILASLLQQPALIGTDASPALAQQAAYRDLELYRALGFLLYAARNEPAQQQLWQQQQPLLQWLLAQVSHSSGWQLQHQLWALAYWQLVLPATNTANQGNTTTATDTTLTDCHSLCAKEVNTAPYQGLTQPQLDARVWQALLQNRNLSTDSRKQLFSHNYLVNSFRTRESCLSDFANQCQLIEPDQILTSTHDCSVDTHTKVDSQTINTQLSKAPTAASSTALQIRIRHQGLSAAQLQQSCRLMLAQTSSFADLLQSTAEPVANDHNQRLEVMIFPDYTAYNRDSSLAFDIQTNNGGMYIEATPGDPANQARFFSFQQFWQPEPFAVWNLAHEFVHYLDGRFNLYGGFEHYPAKTVWWSEGLAEFISQTTPFSAGTAPAHAPVTEPNIKALQLLQNTEPSEFLTLSQIFATSYSEHGQDQIYRWSYWAWRFLATDDPTLLRRLTSYLRGDFFQGYSDLLDEIAADKQAAFQLFLLRQRQLASTNQPPRTDARPDWQPLGRYLYRSDLTPSELPASGKHFHLWQLPAVAQLNTQAGAKP